MNRDGTEQTNLTENPAGDFTPAWQPLEKKRRQADLERQEE
jgi:hypothetical protein